MLPPIYNPRDPEDLSVTGDLHTPVLGGSSEDRKATPMATGLLDYFPAALAEVAKLSKAGNDKHNPGQLLHWSRGKSADHADTIVRHLVDRGTIDPEDGLLHDVKVAWRALAMLQEELERRGAQPGRGSRFPEDECQGDTATPSGGDFYYRATVTLHDDPVGSKNRDLASIAHPAPKFLP